GWSGVGRTDGYPRRRAVCLVHRHRGQSRGNASAHPAQGACARVNPKAKGGHVRQGQTKVDASDWPLGEAPEAKVRKFMTNVSVIWRRLDQPGHEAARLSFQGTEWRLTGTAVFASDGRPCRLDYLVACDADWRTRSGRVTGWLGT